MMIFDDLKIGKLRMTVPLPIADRVRKFKNRAFAALNKSTGGNTTCVQVGAHDGKRWDPVFPHITQNGWNALVIEPHPIFFQRLSENYADYPNVTPVNVAISDEERSFLLFHVSEQAAGKYQRWLQGCASVHVNRMTDSLKRAAHYAGVASEIGDMIATTIHAKRLDRVLSENNYNRIDILVIDVEGHELAVLNSLSDPETFPKLAIIECNGRDLSRQAEYIEILSSMGLRIWRVGDDLWCLSDALIKDQDQQLSDLIKEIHPEPRNIQSQTANSDSKNQTIKVGLAPIPKKLGHIWIGDKQPPLEWMETWKQKHPDWDYQLFDNSYLSSRRWRCEAQIAEYMRRKQYAGLSDLMRYEILFEQGGFLPEADSICLRNVDELFVLPALYTAYEHEIKRPGLVSPFYASSPGHSFLAQILDELSQLQPESLLPPFKSVGNRALRDFIKKWDPDVSIFPSYFFNPRHHTGETYKGDGPVYAEQLWGTTKRLYGDLPDDQRAAALAITENLTDIWQGLPVNS